MNNQEDLGKAKMKNLYVFTEIGTDKYAFFTTASKEIIKTICQKKQSIKQSVLTEILKTNYNYILLKEDILKENINIEIAKYEDKLKKDRALAINNLSIVDKYIQGICKEEELIPFLQIYFKAVLIRSKYKYSIFDAYSMIGFLFEIKSYLYPYDKYPTEIIGIRKGICDNCIFVFSHLEKDNSYRYFWVRYTAELFDKFEIFDVKSPNRLKSELSYRIDKNYLTEFKLGDIIDIDLEIEMNDTLVVASYIVKDNNKSCGIQYDIHTINNLIENHYKKNKFLN